MPGFFPGARENIAVPDDRKGQIVFKWPDHEIRRFTHAIVAPDELAVFMYQGQVKGTLPPGRHSIDATELPFLGIFADALTGGNRTAPSCTSSATASSPRIASGARSTRFRIRSAP